MYVSWRPFTPMPWELSLGWAKIGLLAALRVSGLRSTRS
jgi:hypothetical protein